MHLISLAENVGIRSLGAVGGAEDFQILTGEKGVAVNIVACGGRNIVLDQGLLQSSLRGCFAHGALRRFRSRLHHARGRCRLICRCGAGYGSFGSSLSVFLRLHLVQDGNDTILIGGIICRADSVDVDSAFEQSCPDFSLIQAALVEFSLGHCNHSGVLRHHGDGQSQRNQKGK